MACFWLSSDMRKRAQPLRKGYQPLFQASEGDSIISRILIVEDYRYTWADNES